MALVYSVYGLGVPADAPIPDLLPCDRKACIDVRVRVNRLPSYVDDSGRPRLTVWRLKGGLPKVPHA